MSRSRDMLIEASMQRRVIDLIYNVSVDLEGKQSFGDYLYDPSHFAPNQRIQSHDDFLFEFGDALKQLAQLHLSYNGTSAMSHQIEEQMECISDLIKEHLPHIVDSDNLVMTIDELIDHNRETLKSSAVSRVHISYDSRNLKTKVGPPKESDGHSR